MRDGTALDRQHSFKTGFDAKQRDTQGMCGGCRLTVGGETKFACVDGPDFDGDLVDFDEAMARGTMYRPFEAKAREKACNLFKTEEAK